MDYTHGTKKHRTIEPHGRRYLTNFEHTIHCLETEAYGSILKSFIAQSDLLTWGKEGLMTDLRKELNITDVEHGEILTAVNLDESIKWIREQRNVASHDQDYFKVNTPGCASSTVGSSVIRLKTSSSSAFYPQKNMSHSQISLTSIPIHSSMPPKFNDDRLTAEFSHGKQTMEVFNCSVQLPVPPMGRGGVPKGKHSLKKDLHASECVQLKNISDLIEIRATDRVIHDVEKMLFSSEKPDPVEIERAKWTLRDQERAIIEALGKLTDALARDDPSDQMQRYEVPKITPRGQEMMIHGSFCGLTGRLSGLGDSFRSMPSG